MRALERELSKICRKVVKGSLLKKGEGKSKVTPRNLDKYLGVRRYTFGMAEKEPQVGQVTGLAWTEVGGELLTIEAAVMPGKGNTIRTGSLGDVMKESVEAARSVVRSRARRLCIKDEVFDKTDIHVHLPEGATPKDGPSAGTGMCTALVSALTKIPVRADVAMTCEITLRGEVLPIGGLKAFYKQYISWEKNASLLPGCIEVCSVRIYISLPTTRSPEIMVHSQREQKAIRRME